MKSKDFVEYVKNRPYSALIFIAAIFISTTGETMVGIIVFLADFIMEYLHYNSSAVYLRQKGLTEAQENDLKFVEAWAETRQGEMMRYCLYDGGIIIGSVLSVFVGAALLASGILGDISNDLSSMMGLICKSFTLAFIIACLYNRLRWPYKENRFAKLAGGEVAVIL